MEHEYWKHLGQMDPDSFRDLMVTYGRDVWNFAYFLTDKAEMADDIAQDVFLKAYQSIGTFRGESTVLTWLLAIAKHTSINYKRSAFMRRVLLVDRVFDRGAHPSAEDEAPRRSISDDIWNIVLSLPVKYREVLILNAKHEMSMQEIAGVLGLSEGTVKSRLSRARRKVAALRKEVTLYEQV